MDIPECPDILDKMVQPEPAGIQAFLGGVDIPAGLDIVVIPVVQEQVDCLAIPERMVPLVILEFQGIQDGRDNRDILGIRD